MSTLEEKINAIYGRELSEAEMRTTIALIPHLTRVVEVPITLMDKLERLKDDLAKSV